MIKKNLPVIGVVYAPFLKKLYFAEETLGSFKIEQISSFKQFSDLNPVNLKDLNFPKKVTVVVSRSHMNEKTEDYVHYLRKKYGEVVLKSFGSSLKLCKVAERKANYYPRFGPTMEWDTAAAHAIVKFSGCVIIDATNQKELTYNKRNLLNPHFIVKKNEFFN